MHIQDGQFLTVLSTGPLQRKGSAVLHTELRVTAAREKVCTLQNRTSFYARAHARKEQMNKSVTSVSRGIDSMLALTISMGAQHALASLKARGDWPKPTTMTREDAQSDMNVLAFFGAHPESYGDYLAGNLQTTL